MWYPHMDLYFTACLTDAKLPRVAAHILEVNPSGLYFMDVVLGYLLDKRLASLRQPDSPVRSCWCLKIVGSSVSHGVVVAWKPNDASYRRPS